MDQPSGDFKYMLRRIAFQPPQQGPPLPGLPIAPLSGPPRSTAKVQFRPIWQMHPIRGELEIMHFGRQTLIDTFASNTPVLTLPLVIFLDAFGLYRNMYRSLLGCYFLNGAFGSKERNRRMNLIPFTIGPHGSNTTEVVAAIAPLLAPLDAGMKLDLNGVETVVCAMPFFFIGDMPQQAANAGFLTQRATFGCRSCTFKQTDWKSLELDVVGKGRYHHEIERIRKQADTLDGLPRKTFIEKHQPGMALDRGVVEAIAPTVDRVVGNPGDPPHSECGRYTKVAHSVLKEAVLTPKA
ncbi:unnamed protein product [Zymoseptoria tritici ST99CH_1E4]|uniref:Uncharacterized protein n=1 Tax=Zymoseptoria tritici ST99CH_1E4 TaxID=1276532 RepID=A0A2H1FLJ7_ZYMTR|nr:unnamed protein product [Zymoseptoria tritici ST99CH_1E4]